MFEKEIKFIADFNLNKIKSLGSFITFEKLSNSGIHPSVIQYISAELDYLIDEDRKKLLQQSLFDYSGAEVNKYFNLIAQEIKKNKKIAYEDLKKLVIQAVSFNMNFIVRPKWSLTKLIYNNAETKPIDEIRLLLNYIYYYDYLKNIYFSYLSKRKLFSLSITEFESILNKIDKELFSSQPKTFIDNTLYTIGEFFNVGEVNKVRISTVAVEIFLKEKNLLDYLFRLRKAIPKDTKQTIDIDDVRSILYSKTPISKIVPVPEDETEKSEADIEFADTGKTESETEEAAPVETEDTSVNKEQDLFWDEEKNEEDAKNEEIESEGDKNENTSMPEVETPGETEENKISGEEDLLDKEMEIDTGIDEDLLSLYESEFKIEEEDSEKTEIQDSNEKTDISNNDDLDSLYDFEKESKELLKDFNESKKEIIEQDEDVESGETEVNTSETEEINSGEKFEDIFEEEEETITPQDDKNEMKVNEESNNSVEEDRKPPKKNKDIFNFLSSKDIDKIVAGVFNEDREDFANTLEKLTECYSYEEATEILKSVFLTYRVNPYSKDAVNLTNAVSNYFEQG